MATMIDMGVPGDGVDGILQPFYKNRWRIVLKNFGGDPRPLTAMAVTAERPKYEYEEIQIDRYNSRAYLQGKYTFQPISLVLEPDIGGAVHRAIQAQTERQQRLIAAQPGTLLGQALSGNSYKFAMDMEMLDGDHTPTTEPLEVWKLEGCALNNLDFGDLDYQASETVKTTLQIRYDHAYQIILGKEGTTTGGANPL